jgi:hypothetical protein
MAQQIAERKYGQLSGIEGVRGNEWPSTDELSDYRTNDQILYHLLCVSSYNSSCVMHVHNKACVCKFPPLGEDFQGLDGLPGSAWKATVT